MDITDLQVEVWGRRVNSAGPDSTTPRSGPVGISLHDAVFDDADAIAEIHVDSWRWAYKLHLPESVLESISVEQRAAMWRRSIDPGYPGTRIVLARSGGRPAGFIAFGPLRGGPENIGEVYSLYVAPQHLRKGVGAALMSSAVDHFTAHAIVTASLWVLTENVGARAFYRNMGWHDTSKFREEMIENARLHETQMLIEFA